MKDDTALKHRAFGMFKKKVETERRIHTRLCKYMRGRYPEVRFVTTLDGEFFSQNQAEHVRALQHSTGAPDMLIFWPNGKYVGLALELKRDDVRMFKRDGNMVANPHFREQSEWLDYLVDVGWVAKFAFGYEEALDIVNTYMNLNIKTP